MQAKTSFTYLLMISGWTNLKLSVKKGNREQVKVIDLLTQVNTVLFIYVRLLILIVYELNKD